MATRSGLLGLAALAGAPWAAAALDFHHSVTEAQRRTVERDLAALCLLDHGREFPAKEGLGAVLEEALGIGALDCASLAGFLEDRIDLIMTRLERDDLVVEPGPGRRPGGPPPGLLADSLARNVSSMLDGGVACVNAGPVLRFLLDRLGPRGAADVSVVLPGPGGRASLLPVRSGAPNVLLLSPDVFFGAASPGGDGGGPDVAGGVLRTGVLLHELQRWDARGSRPFAAQAAFVLYAAALCPDRHCGGDERDLLIHAAESYVGRLDEGGRAWFCRRSGLPPPLCPRKPAP